MAVTHADHAERQMRKHRISQRQALEATAEFPQLEKTVGADGRERTVTPFRDVGKFPTSRQRLFWWIVTG